MDKNKDREQEQAAERVDIKSHVAKTLIEAMERGDAPWQKPWKAKALSPTNPTTMNAYKGVNRLLLAMEGRSSNLWMTYQQAAQKGWQVRKGERGTAIVKVVELGGASESGSETSRKGEGQEGEKDQTSERKAFALRRYVVFNAEQVEGFPLEAQPEEQPFNTAERAESAIEAMKERTGLMVIHGGDRAAYIPALDEVRLPVKRAFKTEYDYYSTALHEICHSTLHEKRMNRRDALGQRWGDAAYSLEELRAEIGSAILAEELGAQASPEHMKAHVENHAAYLRSWIQSIQRDPMAIFSAARDAEKMAEYVLALEREHAAMRNHKEWVAEYDQAPEARLARRA